jgi:uncharacterized LabA/DUF88 family protein
LKTVVFVDGTNLFCQLHDLRLRVPQFKRIWEGYVGPRRLVWSFLYTTKEKVEKHQAIHGPEMLQDIHPFYGYEVTRADGRRSEKAVDEHLVADLIYHAARGNLDHAILVAVDGDYSHAVSRVRDFGCTTAVLAVGKDAPAQLREACDQYKLRTKSDLVRKCKAVERDD